VQFFRESYVCYYIKSLGAACAQDVRSLEENKLIQVQLQHDSGLAGIFESLISGVQHVGNFKSTYSSGLHMMGYDHVPPLATILKAMIVSIINPKTISLNVVWHWTSESYRALTSPILDHIRDCL
jgi:hypothetical protein